MINPKKKKGFQGGWGQENHSVYKALTIFGNFEVKEAGEVIEAVEVIMAEEANEATEVFRFI